MDEKWKTVSCFLLGFRPIFSRDDRKHQAKGSGAAVVTVPTSVKSLMLRMVDTGPGRWGREELFEGTFGLEIIFRFSTFVVDFSVNSVGDELVSF